MLEVWKRCDSGEGWGFWTVSWILSWSGPPSVSLLLLRSFCPTETCLQLLPSFTCCHMLSHVVAAAELSDRFKLNTKRETGSDWSDLQDWTGPVTGWETSRHLLYYHQEILSLLAKYRIHQRDLGQKTAPQLNKWKRSAEPRCDGSWESPPIYTLSSDRSHDTSDDMLV